MIFDHLFFVADNGTRQLPLGLIGIPGEPSLRQWRKASSLVSGGGEKGRMDSIMSSLVRWSCSPLSMSN